MGSLGDGGVNSQKRECGQFADRETCPPVSGVRGREYLFQSISMPGDIDSAILPVCHFPGFSALVQMI